jgi:hypothetical protein
MHQVLHGASRLVATLLAAGGVLLLVLGALGGDVSLFGVGLLASALLANLAGRWLENRQPGGAFALLYGSLAVLNLICVYGYIVPLL